MAKTLHLTLQKKWFDMILRGEKKEEYRELKPYWRNRLNARGTLTGWIECNMFRYFDTIRFTNGYGADKPTFEIECKGISIGEGKTEWGFEKTCFVIKLGNILSTNNLSQ